MINIAFDNDIPPEITALEQHFSDMGFNKRHSFTSALEQYNKYRRGQWVDDSIKRIINKVRYKNSLCSEIVITRASAESGESHTQKEQDKKPGNGWILPQDVYK